MRARVKVLWILTLILATGLVFGFPLLVKQQAEKFLSEYLHQSVAIKAMSFNPFLGTASIDELKIGENTGLFKARINIEMWPLLQRHLHIQSLNLSGIQLPVSSSANDLSVADFPIATETSPTDEAGGAWRVSIEALILDGANLAVNYQGAKQELVIQSFSLGLFDTTGQKQTPVTAALLLNGSAINMQGEFLILADVQKFSADITITDLDLAALSTSFAASSATLGSLSGRLDLHQSIEIGINAQDVTARATGGLQMRAGSLAGNQASKLDWDGQLTYLETGLSLAGELKLNGLASQFGEFGHAEWRGELGFRSTDDFSLQGDVRVDELVPFGMGKVGQLLVSDIDLTPTGLFVQNLAVSDADLLLERLADGQFAVAARLSALAAGDSDKNAESPLSAPSPTSDTSPASEMDLKVQKVQLKNSKLEFVDRSVEPLVDLELDNMVATINEFSLADTFDFEFVADHQRETGLEAKLKAKGDVEIKRLNGNVDFSLSNFELHEIAPYLGNGVRSGRLQLDSGLKMNAGRLSIKNKIHIKNVKIDESAQNSGDQMSLATALFLLKDKNDEVELEVPIETDFDKFEIGFNDIFQTALIRAARTTAVTYAQYALQPYGSLLLAKDLLGVMTRPKFEPVAFERGSGVLTPKAKSYVEKLAGLLVTKSELTVTVCGFADLSELERLREIDSAELADSTEQNDVEKDADQKAGTEEDSAIRDVARIKTLAQIRSRSVKAVLKAGGVLDNRLYACTATAESNGGKPRVEIAL